MCVIGFLSFNYFPTLLDQILEIYKNVYNVYISKQHSIHRHSIHIQNFDIQKLEWFIENKLI